MTPFLVLFRVETHHRSVAAEAREQGQQIEPAELVNSAEWLCIGGRRVFIDDQPLLVEANGRRPVLVDDSAVGAVLPTVDTLPRASAAGSVRRCRLHERQTLQLRPDARPSLQPRLLQEQSELVCRKFQYRRSGVIAPSSFWNTNTNPRFFSSTFPSFH